MGIKKQISKYQNLFFIFVMEQQLKGCRSVLDVGCGHSSIVGSLKKTFSSEGIDIHKKTIDLSRKNKTHDKYKIGNIMSLPNFYKKKSFDACVSIDVIEHFTKKDALRLIKNMENVAVKKIIILTPNGFYEQHDYDGNPHQEHKSGWSKNDLEKLGYKVYGLRGLKYLRDEHAGIKYKPWAFWGACGFISEILFFPFASASFDLLAIKDLKEKA
jgi:SAM-dependent methyltransferase